MNNYTLNKKVGLTKEETTLYWLSTKSSTGKPTTKTVTFREEIVVPEKVSDIQSWGHNLGFRGYENIYMSEVYDEWGDIGHKYVATGSRELTDEEKDMIGVIVDKFVAYNKGHREAILAKKEAEYEKLKKELGK